VNAVANLAADLKLGCVVEGVETEDQRNSLPRGVQIQGWLTGRPQLPEVLGIEALCPTG
jgi:sensor c-di-GMP phosphodiesterase-like protein